MTNTRPEEPRRVSVSQARDAIARGPIQIVDVRAPFDFAGGHIPGAVNYPGRAFEVRSFRLQRDLAVLLVSSDGADSLEVCAAAMSAGFIHVSNLEGGFEGWLEAGYEIHTISDSPV